jgi:PAS domain S-box-containing protein
MISANGALTSSYDYGEVARSVLIAIVASYAALDLAERITAAKGWVRLAWLSAGATAMGIGVWAMHFKGMLAFRLPIAIAYHWPTVLLSLVVAGLASAVALYVVSRQKMGPVQVWTGSLLMGGGIATMHYIGMAAMRLAAVCRFSPVLVTLSIVLAIVFSFVALLLAFGIRQETKGIVPRKIGSAVVMGAAISAMHYTGMAAASFVPSAVAPDLSLAVSISPLANNGIAMVTLLVLGAAIVTSSVDRQAEAVILRLNEELERRVVERTSQLSESESRFRLLFEKNLAGVVIASRGQVLDCNQAYARILGFESPQELRGRLTADFYFNPLDRQPILVELERAGAVFSRELKLRKKDGTPRWVLFNSLSFSANDGTPLMLATTIDTTALKQAADRLVEYEKAVEGLEETIVVLDRSYRYVLANRAFLNRHGLEREQLLGRFASEILNEGAVETIAKEKLDECFDGKVVTYEMKYKYPKLGERDLHISYFPIEGPKGIDRVACVLQDITERKRAEEAQLRLATIVRSSDDAIISKELDGVITTWNAGAQRIFGYTPAEAIGRPITLIVPPELLDEETMILQRLRAGEHIRHYETVRITKQGARVDVSLTISPMKNSEGQVVGASKIARDITERKRSEQALQKTQSELAHVTRALAMEGLVASIAHEVNQPLTGVVTNGNFALRELASGTANPEKVREAIAEVVEDGTRASAVISRIRALFRKGAPDRVQLNINDVIQEVAVLTRSEASQSRVQVRLDLGPGLPLVKGDRVQLQQVLINLLINSIEAMRSVTDRPRQIVVKSAMQANGVLVRVEDSGRGLGEELAGRIFEPFFTTKPHGIGIGLSISRSIIESHGGRLWAEPGSRGALFQFILPTDSDRASENSAA